ncbi:hypothetical protein BLOT_014663 [Blomia tropicalis]|nr:hypothetical protein BLOT_014663 [Blomia tropicalis]
MDKCLNGSNKKGKKGDGISTHESNKRNTSDSHRSFQHFNRFVSCYGSICLGANSRKYRTNENETVTSI